MTDEHTPRTRTAARLSEPMRSALGKIADAECRTGHYTHVTGLPGQIRRSTIAALERRGLAREHIHCATRSHTTLTDVGWQALAAEYGHNVDLDPQGVKDTTSTPDTDTDTLTDDQADGFACVICGVDFRTVAVPAGRSPHGQTFRCASHDDTAHGEAPPAVSSAPMTSADRTGTDRAGETPPAAGQWKVEDEELPYWEILTATTNTATWWILRYDTADVDRELLGALLSRRPYGSTPHSAGPPVDRGVRVSTLGGATGGREIVYHAPL